MASENPWGDMEQTFASARAHIRDAQDVVLAEHKRQTDIDAVGIELPAELVEALPALRSRRVGR